MPSVVSLNARSTSISRAVTMTNDASTAVTVATVRLEPGTSARVRITAECKWSGMLPASLSAEFLIGHYSGAAPEPNDTTSPRQGGH